MKILFVAPPPYLPNRLHRNRSFDLIKILSKKHEAHLLLVTTHKKEPKEFKEIKKVCKSIKIIYLNPIEAILNCLRFPFLPAEVAYCYSREATKEIQNEVKRKNIDLIYLKRLRSAIYLPLNNDTDSITPIPVVIDTTDAMSMFYNRLYKNSNYPKKIIYKLEEVKYRTFEKKTMEKIKNWIVCSPIDQKYLQKLEIPINIYVVPNPVDTEYFSFVPKLEYHNALLFRGLMNKPVNIDAVCFFVEKIFPNVEKKIKNIKLYIVGPKPHKAIKKYNNGKNIFVTGFVKDIRKYITETDLSICPVRIASGTRFKILHAWAMGKPVVSTTVGAEGLLYKKNKNIAIADNPKEFAKQIINLLKNKKHYDTLAENGRETIVREYSFKVIAQKLETVIQDVKITK